VEDIISELRKVTWPTRQDTFNLTLVVVVVSVAVGLTLGGIDLLFNWFIENTLLR
jgi:preprotein translocase subunit SecE